MHIYELYKCLESTNLFKAENCISVVKYKGELKHVPTIFISNSVTINYIKLKIGIYKKRSDGKQFVYFSLIGRKEILLNELTTRLLIKNINNFIKNKKKFKYYK